MTRKSWTESPLRLSIDSASNCVFEEVLSGTAISTLDRKGFDFCFGGSLRRNRRFDFESETFDFGRNRFFEEVSGGIAVSTLGRKGFDFCFGGSLRRNRRFDFEPEIFDFGRNRFFEEVSGGIAVSTSATRLAFKILN